MIFLKRFPSIFLAIGAVLTIMTAASSAFGAGVDVGQTEKQAVNFYAVTMFVLFVVLTLAITYWASKRNKTAVDFYAAGGNITGFQNGLAIAGDYMSAASFLGISALVYGSGFDGLIFSVGWLIGWPIILFLIAERLRNLGRFTFADVVGYRLSQKPVRIFAASSTLIVGVFYLVGQMVGAGQLVKLLFGLDYLQAVIIVSALMMIYVTFGGMTATTWVQIIKACLLLGGATFIVLGVMFRFGFSFEALFSKAIEIHPKKSAIMVPGSLVTNPLDAISLGLTLMFGTAGLPHILMRFFTVPNAKEARKSVFYATGFIGYFYILTFIIGFGAISLVLVDPQYLDVVKGGLNLKGGGNMPAIWLAHAIGGDFFLGFISAVAFATILAVVSGLTLAGASAISHDLYANVFARGKANEAAEVRVSKMASLGLGAVATILGVIFENQNVAFIVALTFSIAASATFPILVMSMFSKSLTTRGAMVGGYVGLLGSLGCVILSKVVWVQSFGFAEPIFPYIYPTLFTMPMAFLFSWVVSILDKSSSGLAERESYGFMTIRSETGLGAEGAAKH